MYIGSIDFQAKIMGYRVELSEVEYYAKTFLDKINVAAVPIKNSIGDTLLGLAIETETCDTKDLINSMKQKVPHYMVPFKIATLKEFPLNSNGKIDRKELARLLSI
jgi:acyl-CoA synthetase (AMP-forming)/AMP-acid ligase II